jgi:hypothetical protein
MPNYAVRLKTGIVLEPGRWVEVAERPLCQVCTEDKQEAEYDARASDGRWGYFCLTHFHTLGCSLGLGRGQRLLLDGEYKEAEQKS